MKTLNLIQGSPEWLSARRTSRNASDAPSMMGEQAYGKTRTQLIHFMATGEQEEVSEFLQSRFAAGHAAEAAARPIAEALIGEELFPVVGESDDGYLRASFDGVTMSGIGWEHKLYSDKLAAMIESGELSGQYIWQLEQQCIVGGLSKILFMCSDGTPDKCEYMWYLPSPERAQKLIDGWKRFDKDLEAYTAPVEHNDQDWFDACERYRAAKTQLDAAQANIDAIKGELVELAGNRSAYGCGINVARVEKSGAVKWAEVAKALNPPADLVAKFTGKASTSFTVTFIKEK